MVHEPPIIKSEGEKKAMLFALFLYFLLSRNFPSMIPEFFCAGSKMERVSSAKKKEIMNFLSTSSGFLVFNFAVNLRIFLSLSTYLKKSFLGCFGINLFTYPKVSSSSPNPLYGGTSGAKILNLNHTSMLLWSWGIYFSHWEVLSVLLLKEFMGELIDTRMIEKSSKGIDCNFRLKI
jgi:hypothetical protein